MMTLDVKLQQILSLKHKQIQIFNVITISPAYYKGELQSRAAFCERGQARSGREDCEEYVGGVYAAEFVGDGG